MFPDTSLDDNRLTLAHYFEGLACRLRLNTCSEEEMQKASIFFIQRNYTKDKLSDKDLCALALYIGNRLESNSYGK